MKVFIVSLKESVERRDRISKLLDGMEVSHEIFDAVNGREGLPAELSGMPDDQHRRILRSRPLTGGEKGCYASHYLLWQKCVELNEPILIIEDDCLPTHYLKQSLPTLEKLFEQGYEYLRVEPQHGQARLVEDLDGMQVVYWLNNQMGTGGYSIAPSGAKKLLKHSGRWLCSVDNFIGESYRTKLKCTGVMPYLVLNLSDLGTTIHNLEPKVKTPIHLKVSRELYRFYRFIRLNAWNYQNR